MTMVEIGESRWSMDGYLIKNLTFMKKLPENDWDVVGLCTGYEGSGKTTLFMQMAYYLDHNFNIDNIVFNAEQFDKATEILPAGSCILYDECDDSAVGANWMQSKVKAIVSKMKRIRSKNLFILFVTPTFFDLSKYFAVHRTRFLIYVYSKGLKRGFFRFYNRDAKKMLYFTGKKFWNMDAAKSSFHGGFIKLPKGFPVDMNDYNKKKDDATAQVLGDEEDKTSPAKVLANAKAYQADVIRKNLSILKKIDYNNQEWAQICGIHRNTLLVWRKSLGNSPDELCTGSIVYNQKGGVDNVDVK